MHKPNISQKKTLMFVYNFPHKKSVDFISFCIKKNIFIDVIVGCDYVKIKKPERVVNFHENVKLEHPRDIAKKLKIPYFNCDHNSQKTQAIVKSFKINFAIIAGARIIKENIIQSFSFGVLNIHPGLLPESRGLDAILWSIYKNKKLGVTAHLINRKIDSGRLVIKKIFKPSKEDTIFDIYKKLYSLQLKILPIAYNLVEKTSDFPNLDLGSYNTHMSKRKQSQVLKDIKSYIENYSRI